MKKIPFLLLILVIGLFIGLGPPVFAQAQDLGNADLMQTIGTLGTLGLPVIPAAIIGSISQAAKRKLLQVKNADGVWVDKLTKPLATWAVLGLVTIISFAVMLGFSFPNFEWGLYIKMSITATAFAVLGYEGISPAVKKNGS
jgi:hypothetical protein